MVRDQKLKLVVMSATLSLTPMLGFFAHAGVAVVEIQGRQFPLYVFEPEEDAEFVDDNAVQNVIVEVAVAEAMLDIGGVIAFVRGKSMLECVVALVKEHVSGSHQRV